MSLPQLTPVEIGALTGLAGKVFIELADSMPPPPAECGFWCRWCYDFTQRLASNGSRVGQVRPPRELPPQ